MVGRTPLLIEVTDLEMIEVQMLVICHVCANRPDGDGIYEDCEGNNLSEDENTVGVCWNDWSWDGECLTCYEDWEKYSIYASNNE